MSFSLPEEVSLRSRRWKAGLLFSLWLCHSEVAQVIGEPEKLSCYLKILPQLSPALLCLYLPLSVFSPKFSAHIVARIQFLSAQAAKPSLILKFPCKNGEAGIFNLVPLIASWEMNTLLNSTS